MGKVTSLYGKTQGKIGAIVFSTSGGYTIAREYNPHVANPNTMPQINQRARMKLMSQLSAALAPVIVMRKEGLTSARNKFVQRNFENTYASEGIAQVSYENVQLTSGNAGLPSVHWIVEGTGATRPLYVYFTDEPSTTISRVVYCLFQKTDEGKLAYVSSIIVSERGDASVHGYFEGQFNDLSQAEGKLSRNYVIYAYGMSDTSEKAAAKYGNLNVQNGTDIARLVATRTISFEDYQFTQTRGTSANSGSGESEVVPAGSARVFVTALGDGGSVTGGGVFEIGEQVTVVATPAAGYDFVRWAYNGSNTTASTSASYTFTLNGQTDLVAIFEIHTNDTL